MKRKFIALTQGYSNPQTAKTARNLIAYCPEEVLAVFDAEHIGKTSSEILGIGDVPFISSLSDCSEADTLVIGVALPGGIIPPSYKQIIHEAISKKMNIISCGHEFISNDFEISEAAKTAGIKLIDVRKNEERIVTSRKGLNNKTTRILTIGNDCSLGKMVTSVELTRSLQDLNIDAKFVATGQTGILIEGDGIPIDAVVGDYINGSSEKLILSNQHHEVLIIEGQASIVHPRYSSVSLGLLHGTMPQGMIMCYEAGREFVHNMPGIKIPPMNQVINLYEQMAAVMFPSKVIGFAINTRNLNSYEAKMEISRIEKEFELPATDVVRFGSKPLVDAIIKLKSELQ